MNIPQFAIKNYQFTITAFVFFLAMGLNAYFTMPRAEDPIVDFPSFNIVAIYPGATPKDLESQVVDPIEEALNELEDIDEIITEINNDVAVIRIEFLYGVDTDDKYDDVQSKIAELKDELPDNLYDVDVIRLTTSSVAIFQLALVSNSATYYKMKREAERLKKAIEKVDGVKKIDIEAYPERELRIALDPVKMKEMGISLDEVERAVQSNNANIPGGAIKVSNKLFNVKTSGAYDEIEQVRNTVVGSYLGKIIYLKNIASVFFDYEDENYYARFNGDRSIVMSVQQKEGYNIFDVAKPVREKLDQIQLADDIQLEYVFNQSEGVRERVSLFTNNLLQGIFLVGLIIFLVLGIRSSSIVMLTIPLSILIGLWVVFNFDYGLQQMSIAGLVVALGLLVDNSIAIIENIERFLGMGYSQKQAAVKGTIQLMAPMTSATLTTVLAFIPIIMMPDETGAFIAAMPVTVIATLAASLLIAVTLTPFIASLILREKKPSVLVRKETFAFRQLKKFVEGPYRSVMNLAFRYRTITLSFAAASFVGALLLFPYVGISFFPKAEKPQFRITIDLPKGSNIDATDEVVRYVESVLEEREEVNYYASNVGHGNPRIYYNMFPGNYSSTLGDILVVLKEYDVNEFYQLLDELRTEFSNYSKARINVREFVQGPPSEAPVAIKIYGDNLEKLEFYAQQIEKIARTNPYTVNVENNLATKSTDLFFDINRDKAMIYGVPTHVVDKTVRSFVNGTKVGTFRDKNAEEYDMVMRYDFEDQFKLRDFEKISVKSLNGHFIPLEQLASLEFTQAPTMISHLNTNRVATVLSDISAEKTLDEVVAQLSYEIDQLAWEEGYYYEFKGELEEREESFGGLGMASILALILILGVLVIQFRSFVQPLIIFSALPLAIIGSILMLLIMGVSFSFTAFIGLISLIGIAINNSIVLVDFANKLRAEGKSIREAAARAGEVRLVPIVLTTLTTILGLLPLTLSGGSMWAPMGWTIIGGLISSTFFVLLVVPLLYQLFTSEQASANS